MSSFDINGKVAVVTGGASGIGKGIARVLRDAGASVIVTDIDLITLEKTAAELQVTGLLCDVTKLADVQSVAESVMSEFGRVDIVLNNAGVGSMGRMDKITKADWKWILDVNLWGVIHGVNTFLPLLKENADGGHIFNTSSMAAFDPHVNMGAYAAAKMAVLGLTEVLHKECQEDGGKVKVTALCPGPVKTDIKNGLKHRTDGQTGGLFDVDASVDGVLAQLRWMDPLEVGLLVRDTLYTDEMYLITHPELWPPVVARQDAIMAKFEI